MPNTTKGFPYPAGSDNVDVPGDIQALADAVDAAPGVTSYTSTQIAALSAGAKWAGRVVWNSTAGKLQVSNGSTFTDVDTSVALSSSTPQTLGTAAAGTSSDASRADHRHAMPSASDVGAVANSLVNAKGDLVTATANDTPAILTAGSNGQTLIADSSQTNGLRYVDVTSGGRNRIINGGFDLWQRSTSYTYVHGDTRYGAADRWKYYHNGSTSGTNVFSREAFTVGQTDVPGEPTYFHRVTSTTLGTGQSVLDFNQDIEDVRTLAGQTVTVSLYARSSGSRNLTIFLSQVFGSGGSAQVDTTVRSAAATTTGWVRYTHTVTLPSISGKTIGTGSALRLIVRFSSPGAGETHDIACVQVETGPVATPFEFEPYEATLRKCQRYYQLLGAGTNQPLGMGANYAATYLIFTANLPVSMRIAPSLVATTGTNYYKFDRNDGTDNFNSFTLNSSTPETVALFNNTEISGTAGHAGIVKADNAAASVALSAEL